MANLRRKYNATNTERQLSFGINENCVIRSVDIGTRKKQDGSFINMLMFIKISQLDDEENLYAETEFGVNKVSDEGVSWMKYHENVMRTVNQLGEILEQIYSEEDVDENFDPFSAIGIKNEEDIEKLMKGNPKNCAAFNDAMKQQFKNLLEEYEGLDSDVKFRFKLIYNNKGQFLTFPRKDFCESADIPLEDSSLELNEYDLQTKAEHVKQLSVKSDPSTAKKGDPPIPGKKVIPGKVPGGIPGVKTTSATEAVPKAKPSANPVQDAIKEKEESSLGKVPNEENDDDGVEEVKPPVKKSIPFKRKVVPKAV